MATIRDWLGFGAQPPSFGHGGHDHGADGHGHTHGVIDPSITASERGLWAVKWSFAILAVTAALQLAVVLLSGSVALLADTIHNMADATTAIPLWVAFMLARRKPSDTFTYGLGRSEDLAGLLIVMIILFSAVVAGWEAIGRLIHPESIDHLGWLAAAGCIGFLGNEAVAVLRIRVGRQMSSAALIADGYHARTDGLTSLAVVFGAGGVRLGFPLADPIIGLLITIAILGIVWQSARAVITRALDGVEPEVAAEIRHAAAHVPGIERVASVRARWIGHVLHTDVAIVVDEELSLPAALDVARALKLELVGHLPALRTANVTFVQGETDETDETDEAELAGHAGEHGSHHAPEPFRFKGDLADGTLEIVDTPDGERMRLTLQRSTSGLSATVVIVRPGAKDERLPLRGNGVSAGGYQSEVAPQEPHEFAATLRLAAGGRQEVLSFTMVEPAGHHH